MNPILITAGALAVLLGTQDSQPKQTDAGTTQHAGHEMPIGEHAFAVYRARDVLGSRVQNPNKEKLGEIEDLVIAPDGRISYAVLSFGGFLDIGDKLFALPWNCMRIDHLVQGERGEHPFVIDIPKERLESAPGFDKKHWPVTANTAWCGEVDSYYARASDAQNPRGIPASAAKVGYVLRCSKLKGQAVTNLADEKLGDIRDLVLDPHNGHVSYVVLSVGGFLGVGDRQIAVPWDALAIRHGNDETQVRLDATKERLEGAPVFLDELLNWDRMGSQDWIRDDVYGYFAVDPYWTGAKQHETAVPSESLAPRQ